MDQHDGIRNTYMCGRCTVPELPGRPLQRCGGCQLVAYCSRDCQKDDRRNHKPVCKEFPVFHGINVFFTKYPWGEHLANLRERAAQLPDHSGAISRLFNDPKVCYTCKESRPSLLTMCQCTFVFYCSAKCARADKWHSEMCSNLSVIAEETSLERMRTSYPMTLLSALEEIYTEYQSRYDNRCTEDLVNIKVHVVTNSPYFDYKAWEILFHQVILLNLNQLELVFITDVMPFNQSFNNKGTLNQLECEFCINQDRKDHKITYSVHQMPYHMYFSSSEYSEPDVVIVYGITGINTDIHSDISYRNMTYSEDSVLVLTDSTEDLVIQGSRAVNAARSVHELVPPMKNQLRVYGSNKPDKVGFDAAATNLRYYLTCLKRK